jgi:hypothetical protein
MRRGESKELPALQARLATALAKADVPISSSCLCRTSAQPEQSCCHSTKSWRVGRDIPPQ